MKKLGMLALAAVLVAMFTVPACALESEFGGYWRTRFYINENFSGEDKTEIQDFTGVDTRTRLYYTAIFHENLKFVNKFEINTTWGDTNGGDIGADGTGHIRVKNSYIDANTGPVNWKIGIQGGRYARGFLFDDDFSGMIINYKGEMFEVPFLWIHAFEGDNFNSAVLDENDKDADYYGIFPKFKVGDMFSLNPYFLYIYSKDASGWSRLAAADPALQGNIDDYKAWYLGIDADADFGPGSAWLTFIYQGGDVGFKETSGNLDFGGWLGAIGGAFDIGIWDIHGQGFYATGDKDKNDTDLEAFFIPAGQSYYWSEIMGLGIFDNQASNNAPGDKITNVWALNLGTTVKPMDKLKVTLDAWYAQLVEDILVGDNLANLSEENELGFELDLVVTYEVIQNLNLDLVGAYLWAGDATTEKAPSDANPWELGARLSLAF
jgi:hypothetical protein